MRSYIGNKLLAGILSIALVLNLGLVPVAAAAGDGVPNSGSNQGAQTPTPSTTTVVKTTEAQDSVDFTLTNASAYAAGTVWTVYTVAEGGTPSAIAATLSGSTLTLTLGGNPFAGIPAGDYYVSAQTGEMAESQRLRLSVTAAAKTEPTDQICGDFTVTTTNHKGYSYDGNTKVLTISTAGDYRISMATGTSTTQRLVATVANVNITLDGVKIGATAGCAFTIAGDGATTITLAGENSLHGGAESVGLQFAKGTLAIQGAGRLTVTGGNGKDSTNMDTAGTGGGSGIRGEGTLTIAGSVTATGGRGGNGSGDNQMASGGGNGGNGISVAGIILAGGTVQATGGVGGNGGDGNCQSSTFPSMGGAGGSGISVSGAGVVITGGAVTAYGGDGGKGGNGATDSSGDYSAPGGYGGNGGAGGMGINAPNQPISLNSGTVTAQGGNGNGGGDGNDGWQGPQGGNGGDGGDGGYGLVSSTTTAITATDGTGGNGGNGGAGGIIKNSGNLGNPGGKGSAAAGRLGGDGGKGGAGVDSDAGKSSIIGGGDIVGSTANSRLGDAGKSSIIGGDVVGSTANSRLGGAGKSSIIVGSGDVAGSMANSRLSGAGKSSIIVGSGDIVGSMTNSRLGGAGKSSIIVGSGDVAGSMVNSRLGGADSHPLAQTPTPSTTTVAKTTEAQDAADFTLTNASAYADGTVWTVYPTAEGGTTSDITATLSGSTLTLRVGGNPFTGIPAGDYAVAAKTGEMAESQRLRLSVTEPTDVPESDFTVTTTNPAGYHYAPEGLTITASGEYRIGMAKADTPTTQRIAVAAPDVTITLDKVNIATTAGYGFLSVDGTTTITLDGVKIAAAGCAFRIDGDGATTITLVNENSLHGGAEGAGLQFAKGTLAIQCANQSTENHQCTKACGSLTVTGGNGKDSPNKNIAGTSGGSGISGAGTLTIDGNVTATGGRGGNGYTYSSIATSGGNGGNGISVAGITLADGIVQATGGVGGNGSDEGYDLATTVAMGGAGGSGISVSRAGVVITGGAVTAWGGDGGKGGNGSVDGGRVDYSAPGGGGGNGGAGGVGINAPNQPISLKGGTVTAQGGNGNNGGDGKYGWQGPQGGNGGDGGDGGYGLVSSSTTDTTAITATDGLGGNGGNGGAGGIIKNSVGSGDLVATIQPGNPGVKGSAAKGRLGGDGGTGGAAKSSSSGSDDASDKVLKIPPTTPAGDTTAKWETNGNTAHLNWPPSANGKPFTSHIMPERLQEMLASGAKSWQVNGSNGWAARFGQSTMQQWAKGGEGVTIILDKTQYPIVKNAQLSKP